MKNTKSLRILFQSFQENNLIAQTDAHQTICLICNENQQQELADLSSVLHQGTILNLLNISEIEANTFTAEFLIFEPDYLVDTSSLAECFKPYGHHPLNYSLSRLQ
ncbi:MAG: hypothetical protein LBV57_04035, partial [Candidatus Symbiothrix sp.]|nr:hypothetical protein [Candidatus Symbiothrix sp.]